jgi:hypothetical protein
MDYNQFDLKEILSHKESLNLEVVQKRLVLLALIKANFKIRVAFEINCKGSYYTFDAYDKLYRKHFPGGLKNLKNQFMEQFGYAENFDGKLIKIKLKKENNEKDKTLV